MTGGELAREYLLRGAKELVASGALEPNDPVVVHCGTNSESTSFIEDFVAFAKESADTLASARSVFGAAARLTIADKLMDRTEYGAEMIAVQLIRVGELELLQCSAG